MEFHGSDYIDWSIFTTGSFEPQSLETAIRIMRPGGVLLDIGANHGLYSIVLAAATGCHAVALEPKRRNFERLLANLTLNPALLVTPVNCCATPAATLVQLEIPPEGPGTWTRVNRGGATTTCPRVVGLSLNTILATLEIGAVRLLKIDVEGYEPEALSGLDWKGPCRPRYVLMECAPGETEKLEFLRSRGYSAHTVTEVSPCGLRHFPEGNLLFTDEITE